MAVINAYEPLKQWFERNDFWLAYMEATGPDAKPIDNPDAIGYVVHNMGCYAWYWICGEENLTNYDKAVYASIAINYLYNHYIEVLKNAEGKPDGYKVLAIEVPYHDYLAINKALHPRLLIKAMIAKLEQQKAELLRQLADTNDQIKKSKKRK